MKDAAQKNIIMMSQYEKPRVIPGSSGAFLLNDCRDMAVSRLAKALSSMMEKAVDDLFDLSEQSLNFEMRNLYMEAMTIARDKRGVIETGFKQRFVQGFNKETRGDKSAQPENALDAAEFSLVAPDDLEESLAIINITNSIHGDCAEELFGLEKRLGVLLHDPDLLNTNNPLGPEVIGKSFMNSMKDLDCPVKIKLLLVTMFNKHMPRQIKGIYQEINLHLADKGVLEKIRMGAKKRPESGAAVLPEQTDATPEAAAGAQVASGETGLFATLQQLLMRGAAAGGGAPQGQGAGTGIGAPLGQGVGTGIGALFGQGSGVGSPLAGGAVQGTSVVGSLTRLQHGQLEGVMGADSKLDAALLANGHVNVLHEIKSSSVAGAMGHVDAMTLDIVAMLFDYILDDRRIPDAMKALIGRLQIPVLKVAMLDKTFFSQKSHPARKLLDRLAEISIGWNESEGHQGGLYQTVDDQIQRILNEFDDQVGIFSEVLDSLEQFLVDEKKRIDTLTGLSAQHIHQLEQQEIARIMAHDEIRRRIHAGQLPEVIGNFLVDSWEDVLAAEYAKAGEEGEPWTRAIETMDELIWSATPKREADERKQLVGLLPSLLKRLQDGMVQVSMPDAERDQFFAKLVKCHADAIKSGLGGMTQEAAAQSAFLVEEFDAEEAVELARQAEEPAEFVEIPVLQDVIEPDPVFVQAVSAAPDVELDGGWQTLTIGDVAWQGPMESAGDDFDAMVKRLKRGTWIEFEQEGGESTRVKLAWVSPLKGLFLFTNRLGEKAVSITPAGLARRLRSGRAQIIEDIALVDRAVNNLMEHLKQAA
ncbi:hypothetical protein SKTS_09320 [Sulfurimicrobium lacus]|uniref:Thymidine phosphorylase n=1 Tax=Sulfurimicrobium lacus TaxID=2715678 RepID=A0A6F8VAL6_9PROT|nr:DUF1631 domain-containing protein [Sulfurimicrobium lacus]BCB26046.1 hypothetical protein SKTS_09320 [Sulfurimicrobium lacus]